MQTQPPAPVDKSVSAGEEDLLAEIDRLVQMRRDDEQRSADQMAQLATDRSEFSAEFATVFEEQVRPSMEAIIDRLRRNGGDGLIVNDPRTVVLSTITSLPCGCLLTVRSPVRHGRIAFRTCSSRLTSTSAW